MARVISSGTGRILFMGLIAVGFIGALLSLNSIFGGGAISSKNYSSAFFKILGFYIPLLTLIGTFYFKENLGGTSVDTPFETFLVAAFFILIWVTSPIYILLSVFYIEDVFDYIDKLIPVAQSLALMALGYYFAKRQ
jgi:hypothetical protein